jgi:hypothetical protein
MNDFPSPETVDEIATVFLAVERLKKSRLVRNVLMDSLTIDLGCCSMCKLWPLR